MKKKEGFHEYWDYSLENMDSLKKWSQDEVYLTLIQPSISFRL